MIEYPIGTSGQALILTDEVVEHLKCHRQLKRRQTEAGGQLFARIEGRKIVVVEVTGPRPTDKRTRTEYVPDRSAERIEIIERHGRGLHFVGDWHTHPDTCPRPSARDLDSMAECFLRSMHNLNGFLLLIVGTAELPHGIHASLHDGKSNYTLSAVDRSIASGLTASG